MNRFPQQRMVNGSVIQPRSIALDRIFFAFQGLDTSGSKINKCFTTFSGLELHIAITNRVQLIQRCATSLNSSHVKGFLYQAKQEWVKRIDLRQKNMTSGRGGIIQDDTQPTASQVLRDWEVENRDFQSSKENETGVALVKICGLDIPAAVRSKTHWTEAELSALRTGVELYGAYYDVIKSHFKSELKNRTIRALGKKARALRKKGDLDMPLAREVREVQELQDELEEELRS